jgi:hypothetical protein
MVSDRGSTPLASTKSNHNYVRYNVAIPIKFPFGKDMVPFEKGKFMVLQSKEAMVC